MYNPRRSIQNMCLYLIIQYTMKHQKYVPVSSCMVHDEASEICARILFISTRWSIRSMCQYLVVQYMMEHLQYMPASSCTVHDRHRKYVPVSSCTLHDESSEICASILLHCKQSNIRNMCQYLVVQSTMKHQKYVPASFALYTIKHPKYVPLSSCRVHDET